MFQPPLPRMFIEKSCAGVTLHPRKFSHAWNPKNGSLVQITFLFKFRIMFFGAILIFRGCSSPLSNRWFFAFPKNRWWKNLLLVTQYPGLRPRFKHQHLHVLRPIMRCLESAWFWIAGTIPSLKLTFSPLKMDFGKTMYIYIYNFLLGLALFSGVLNVSFREGRHPASQTFTFRGEFGV